MKTVPQHIRDKCKRIEKLCAKATLLGEEVINWCEKNGIDTQSEKWRYVRDDDCDLVTSLNVDEIEKLLNS